jgi:hypothetical protein
MMTTEILQLGKYNVPLIRQQMFTHTQPHTTVSISNVQSASQIMSRVSTALSRVALLAGDIRRQRLGAHFGNTMVTAESVFRPTIAT